MPKPRPFWDEPEESSPHTEPPGIKFTCTRRQDPFSDLVPHRANRIIGGGFEINIELGLTSLDVSCSACHWRIPSLKQGPSRLYRGEVLVMTTSGLVGTVLEFNSEAFRLNRSGLYDKLHAEDGTVVATMVREWRDSRSNIVNYVYIEQGHLFGEDLPGVVAFLALITQSQMV